MPIELSLCHSKPHFTFFSLFDFHRLTLLPHFLSTSSWTGDVMRSQWREVIPQPWCTCAAYNRMKTHGCHQLLWFIPCKCGFTLGGGEGRVSFFYPKWLLAWNIRPIKKSLTFIFFYFELLIKTRSCFIFVQLHCLQLFWQKCVCLEMVFKTIFLLSFVRYAGTGNLLVCTVRGRTLLDSWQPLCSLPVHFPPLKLQIWLQVVTSNVTKTSIRGKYNSSYSLL